MISRFSTVVPLAPEGKTPGKEKELKLINVAADGVECGTLQTLQPSHSPTNHALFTLVKRYFAATG